jgi:acetyl-CoA carboxylase biotin carboxylase subunit
MPEESEFFLFHFAFFPLTYYLVFVDFMTRFTITDPLPGREEIQLSLNRGSAKWIFCDPGQRKMPRVVAESGMAGSMSGIFKKILIANRGEIALRIARTCREMGIRTVAVYSDIDRKSPHVYFADEAYPLNGKTSRETYLDQSKLLEICRLSGAEALHPGYGFLAENADFASRVEEAGLTFIGPPAEAIALMGNKTVARQKMIAAGVPVVPGTDRVLPEEEAEKYARKIGFPVLIKAAAGGGGKGMRRVDKTADFNTAYAAAQREAASAFGDEEVYIEKYVEEPRHIEFQILADHQGHTIHLGERECSVQRRHQKIIEESPSVLLDDDLRNKMGTAAVKAAEACGYRNAGTIEFLVDRMRNYYFLEMNTRLQVEHPVTELVTGLDLVREQILIAAGRQMTLQTSVECFIGHAIECRIYAENPDDNFAPSPGIVHHIRQAGGPGIREDGGIAAGNEITLFYDPMISKLCAWAPDRHTAIDRMIRALGEYELQGIHSTIPFLIRVLEHPRFRRGDFTTNFIAEEPGLFGLDKQKFKIAALAAVILQQENKNKMKLGTGQDHKTSNWKLVNRQDI